MTRSQDQFDELVDALIYAPIGIAMDIIERYPEHVSRGRRQVEVFEKLGGAVLRGFGFAAGGTDRQSSPRPSPRQPAEAHSETVIVEEVEVAEVIEPEEATEAEIEAALAAEEAELEEAIAARQAAEAVATEAIIAEAIIAEEVAEEIAEAVIVEEIIEESAALVDEDLEKILAGTVGEVGAVIDTLSAPRLEELIRLEQAGKNRVTVLRSAKKRLDDIHDAR